MSSGLFLQAQRSANARFVGWALGIGWTRVRFATAAFGGWFGFIVATTIALLAARFFRVRRVAKLFGIVAFVGAFSAVTSGG